LLILTITLAIVIGSVVLLLRVVQPG